MSIQITQSHNAILTLYMAQKKHTSVKIEAQKYEEHFLKLYQGLNPEQKRAVDTVEGPVVVIAGPGTGKTTILTLRIANILRTTQAEPETILALTFTEAGAFAMRSKLAGIIGTTAYRIHIATFHGFAHSLIQQYPERFPRIIGAVNISDLDKKSMIATCITEQSLTLLRPHGDPLYYVDPCIREISTMKRENISPQDFKKSIEIAEKAWNAIPDLYHEKGAHKGKMKAEHVKAKERIEKNKELLLVYEAYERALASSHKYDYDDMIMEVVRVLESDEDFRLIVQESYQYVLADEHQDANNVQNKLLELVTCFHDNPNLFIVGDEKQAIYRFQGASLDNFLYFSQKYPQAQIIKLHANYRSTQHVLDVAHSLIEHNIMPEGHSHTHLTAYAPYNSRPIDVIACADTASEIEYVTQSIQKNIAEGIKPSHIAILYRANSNAEPYAQALRNLGVQHHVFSEQNLLEDSDVRFLVSLVEFVWNPANDEACATLALAPFMGFPLTEIIDILHAPTTPQKRESGTVSFFRKIENYAHSGSASPAFLDAYTKISTLVHTLAPQARATQSMEMIENIMKTSGFISWILTGPTGLERLHVVDSFVSDARDALSSQRVTHIGHIVDYVHSVKEHGIKSKKGLSHAEGGVSLMTAHSSKGLEFEYVYVVGVNDGAWGNATQRNSFKNPSTAHIGLGTIDDDRRLFYVALTRAKKHIVITHSQTKADGKEVLPSQFIGELNPDLLQHEQYASQNPLPVHRASGAGSEADITLNTSVQTHLRELFFERGLSVTALNNFLECSWKYFFVNLVRIPQAKSKHQMFGTTIHGVLRTFFDKYRVEEDMSADLVCSLFESELSRQPLSDAIFAEELKRGTDMLRSYIEYYTKNGGWVRNLYTEYTLKGVTLPTTFQDESGAKTERDLPLTGNLDKIELLDDTHVNVVDYKTGNPKTRNEIMGLTATSSGNEYRQLCFYRYLVDNDPQHKFNFASAELDFLLQEKNGKLRKERFVIPDNDIETLRTTMLEAATIIAEGRFAEKACKDSDCEFCALAKGVL